jgi:hypothetical protein
MKQNADAFGVKLCVRDIYFDGLASALTLKSTSIKAFVKIAINCKAYAG